MASASSRVPALLRLAVVLLLAVILAIPPGTVGAEPSLDDLRQDTDQAQRRHSQLRDELAAAEQRLEELESEFSLAVDEYHQAGEALEETEARLAQLEAGVAELADAVAEREADVRALVRDLYKNRTGLVGAQALLAGGGPAEVAERFGYLERARRRHAASVEGYLAERSVMERREDELRAVRAEHAERVAELDERRADLEERSERQGAEMDRLEGEVASARERLEEARSAQRSEEERIAQERRERERREQEERERRQAAAADRSSRDASGGESSSGGSSSGGSQKPKASAGAPSAAAQKAVDAALGQVGTPYKWGGQSPSTGFDCSGLAVWAYAQAGVNIPYRSTKAQFANLPKVSRSNLKPGDLVYFRHPVGHMGIYIGDGQMVEAPRSGLSVRVRSINRSDYRGARRPTG